MPREVVCLWGFASAGVMAVTEVMRRDPSYWVLSIYLVVVLLHGGLLAHIRWRR